MATLYCTDCRHTAGCVDVALLAILPIGALALAIFAPAAYSTVGLTFAMAMLEGVALLVTLLALAIKRLSFGIENLVPGVRIPAYG